MEPPTNAEYRNLSYWDSRYSKDKRPSYDWFLSYEDAKSLLAPYIPTSCSADFQLLEIGCGNSPLATALSETFHIQVTAIDYSSVAIQQASLTNTKIRWLVEDIRCLSDAVREGYFDLVVEKGTLDALVAENSSPLFPSDEVVKDLDDALRNIAKVMKPGGKFVSITMGQPHFRLKYLERIMRILEVKELGMFYCYVMERMDAE